MKLPSRRAMILISAAIVGMVLILNPGGASSNRDMQTSSKDLDAFANAALQEYVRIFVTEENYAKYGFRTYKHALEASVGDPLSEMMIPLEQVKSYEAGLEVSKILTDIQVYWFPVISEGMVHTKLQVLEREGEYIAGEFGGTRKVQIIADMQNRLPDLLKRERLSFEEPPLLVRVPALRATFLYLEYREAGYFVPAMINPELLSLENGVIYRSEEVLSRLSKFAQSIDGDVLD